MAKEIIETDDKPQVPSSRSIPMMSTIEEVENDEQGQDEAGTNDKESGSEMEGSDSKEQTHNSKGVKETPESGSSAGQKRKPGRPSKKHDAAALRKAPQAPKRFKSNYICFFTAKQQEIKDQLGEGAPLKEVSRISSEMWRQLSPEERAYWDDVAAKDKQRYMAEKANYTGPWQVPKKRAKKDPSAPKRPMSAFLFFSKERRRLIKQKNPGMKNTDVSTVLGELWKNASHEERSPYVEREAREREQYKIDTAEWKKEYAEKQEAQKKAQEEQMAQQKEYDGNVQGNQSLPPGAFTYGVPNMMQPPYAPGQIPYAYIGPFPPQGAFPPMYPSYPTGAQASSGGRPITVLGPTGMPQSTPPYMYPPGSYPPGFYPPVGYQMPPPLQGAKGQKKSSSKSSKKAPTPQ